MNYRLKAKAGSPGIVGDPNRRLKKTDYLIFISETTDPKISSNQDDYADFEAEAARLGGNARRLSIVENDLELKNVIICGWRREWSVDPARFAARVKNVCSGLAPESTITTINPLDEKDIYSSWSKKNDGGYEIEGYDVVCGIRFCCWF